jgi:SAM-dependent methyltransferase
MRLDAAAVAAFYGSPLGEAARSMLARRVAAAWPDVSGLDVLGYGYAGPLLAELAGDPQRIVNAFPAAQGAVPWPERGLGASVLTEDERLPLMDAVFDRAILVHALEEAQSPHHLLREIWRVMAPEGRLIVIAANRLSPWALSDATPFGHGRPYSRRQLSALFTAALFEPLAASRAVYTPPWNNRLFLKSAEALEAVGERLWPSFGGLVLMEAVKRLEARPGVPGRRVVRAAARFGARA